ncbi:MAG: STAS domain-containing protein [Wenzhouxiangellaceae bacterium]
MTNSKPRPVRLEGRLTVDEVPSVYREHLEWKDDGVPESIDLSGLEATDSAAVALLLEWKQWARQAGGDVRFEHPPEALRTIAGLSHVDKLLGWKEE